MRIDVSVVIARPVEDVWAVLSNFDNVKLWSSSGSGFKQTSPGPLGVGASVEVVRVRLGRFHTRRPGLIVTEYEPNRTLAISARIVIAQQPVVQRITLEPIGEGTRVTRVGEGDLKRGIRPFEGIVASLVSRAWGHELANLKRLVEAGVASEPS